MVCCVYFNVWPKLIFKTWKFFFSGEAKQSLSHSLRYVMHCTFSQAHHKHIECLYVPSPFKYKIHERTHNRLSDYIAIVMITDVSAVLFCICKRLWKRYMRTKRVGVCVCVYMWWLFSCLCGTVWNSVPSHDVAFQNSEYYFGVYETCSTTSAVHFLVFARKSFHSPFGIEERTFETK